MPARLLNYLIPLRFCATVIDILKTDDIGKRAISYVDNALAYDNAI